MPTTINPAFTRLAADGLACIGRSLFDLRGIRFADGDGGNSADAAGSGEDAAAEAALAAAIADVNGSGAQSGAAAEKVEDLPEWAQKKLRDANSEAAKYRVNAKTAADQASKDLTDKLAVALGLRADAATDPAELTKQVTKAQQDARAASIQLAVYKAAGAHQGNPDALLDSNTFLAKVNALDPTAADFGTQVGDAIKAAVAANPSLKAARAASASTVDTAGGSGENGPITEEQLARMKPEQVEKAYREGRLKHLLA